jgi:hypothetical protein
LIKASLEIKGNLSVEKQPSFLTVQLSRILLEGLSISNVENVETALITLDQSSFSGT